jgi:hypothetical protein
MIVLCLLHIPLVLFELMRKEGCPLMPHEVLALVLKHIKNLPTEQEEATANAWQLVVRWCIMAAQKDQQGDSFVLFSVEAITEGGDAYFGQWMENCLDSTMGTWLATEPHMGALGAVTPPQVPAHFAMELGKGAALGLHALGPLLAEDDGKQGYGEEDIAVLMDFLHIKKGSQLQEIWTYFQSLRGKNINVFQRQLMA